MAEVASARRIHAPTLISFLVAGALIVVGFVRFASYSRSTGLADWLLASPLRLLAYDPDSRFSVQFFKILATPSVVAGQYFLFRLLNHLHTRKLPEGYDASHRRLDFRPAVTRLALTTLVTAHWLVIEWWKFNGSGRESFSPLEHPVINGVVLVAGQILAFAGMKYLSFEPLFRREA